MTKRSPISGFCDTTHRWICCRTSEVLLESSNGKDMLAVVTQFGNAFPDIVKRQM